MIPIDPEEVFGLAIWEALQRAFGFIGCIILGSLFAFISALSAQFLLSFTPLSGSYFLPSLSGSSLLMVPLWVMTSAFAFIALPNAFVAVFYYMRCEAPTAKRFFIFAAIQQICLTGAFNEWAFDSSYLLHSILCSALLWFFSLSFLALLFFASVFWKNRQRCNHEEHLMSVAVENTIWRQKLENAEIIPPPPSGPKSPKARPLR
ncbi:MAG: hypothetical protein ACSHYB_10515 [Roseibacillus sp.]